MIKQSPVHFHRMKDLPSTHLLGTGTPMCAGCGGLETLHTMYDILGDKTVFVNAAGCMTLLSVYPSLRFAAAGSTPRWRQRRQVHRVCATPSISCCGRKSYQ